MVKIDLRRPMPEILAELRQHPVSTRLALHGPLVVARDIAHAKLKERLDSGEDLPGYFKDHAVYYAGPGQAPGGIRLGLLWPHHRRTHGRLRRSVSSARRQHGDAGQGQPVAEVRDACRKHGGFYLGSIGGPAARLAEHSIKKVDVLEYPELGMEAIWRIEVEDFPAFIIIDGQGNDFYAGLVDRGGAARAPGLPVVAD